MEKNILTVKHTTKSGEEKVYKYDNKKYYENYKAKHQYKCCDICGSTILSIYEKHHLRTNKCISHAQKKIKNIEL